MVDRLYDKGDVIGDMFDKKFRSDLMGFLKDIYCNDDLCVTDSELREGINKSIQIAIYEAEITYGCNCKEE